MKAGTAKAVITPDAMLRTVVGHMPVGKNHDLYARVLTLFDGKERLVIVTYDLNCLDVATPILRERVRDELGVGVAHLIPMGTHNHAAPLQIVPANFEYGRWLAECIFALIQEAIANEVDGCRVEFGFRNGYFVRVWGNAPVDYEVQLLKVTHAGRVLALLFNQPTHLLQASIEEYCAGHAGWAMDYLEARYSGALALYADACGGNQFPERVIDEPSLFHAGLEKVQALGRKLADTVIRIAESGELADVTGPIASKFEVISLPLAEPMTKDDALAYAKQNNVPLDIGFVDVSFPEDGRATNWVRSLIMHHEKNMPFPKKTADMVCTDDGFLTYEYETPRDFPCRYEEAIVARIGPMAFVSLQGEVCTPLGMRIKDAFRKDHPIMLFAYMGEHNLYIPTRELVRVNQYQAQVLQIQYGCPVGWSPEVEDVMVDNVIRMVSDVCPEFQMH